LPVHRSSAHTCYNVLITKHKAVVGLMLVHFLLSD